MRREGLNYLLAGAFVLLMGALAMVVLYRVTGRTGPTDEYHVYYRNVAGLKYGTAVTYEGFKLGQVERIVPEPDQGGMRYKVVFSVSEGWRIPSDSLARIVATGLISAVSVDIEEGRSAQPLAPGSEIQGREQSNMFAVLNDVAADFQDLSQAGLKPALQTFNDQLGELVREVTAVSREEVRPLLGEVRRQVTETRVLSNLNELVLRLDRSARQLELVLDEDNRKRVDSMLVNLDGASGEMRQLVTDVSETREQLHELLEKLESTVDRSRPGISTAMDDMQEAVADFKTSMRVVSENVESVMYQLDGTTRNLQELTRELRDNPGSLLRNAPPAEEGVAP